MIRVSIESSTRVLYGELYLPFRRKGFGDGEVLTLDVEDMPGPLLSVSTCCELNPCNTGEVRIGFKEKSVDPCLLVYRPLGDGTKTL